MPNEIRPDIDQITNGAELRHWYWLKAELTAEARRRGLKSVGAKFDVLDRIAHFLNNGEADLHHTSPTKVTSTFDWHSAPLNDGTVITDNYRNTQNVRRCFKGALGPKFSFNIAFMEWIKRNKGKILQGKAKV